MSFGEPIHYWGSTEYSEYSYKAFYLFSYHPWKLEKHRGLLFITVSDKVTPELSGYSALTFYIVIVLAVSKVIRSMVAGDTSKMHITEIPKPDMLLILCEGLKIARMERKLEREVELYYVLIDILRSPEVLKIITESSVIHHTKKKLK